MTLLSDMASLAEEIITSLVTDRRGRPARVVLRRRTEGEYEPAGGSESGGGFVDYSVPAAVLNLEDRLVDGSLVRNGDLRVLIPGRCLSFIPALGDILVLDGREHAILPPVKTLAPAGEAGEVILIDLTVRVRSGEEDHV